MTIDCEPYCERCTRAATGWAAVSVNNDAPHEMYLCDFHAERVWARYRRLKWEQLKWLQLDWHPLAQGPREGEL